MTTTTLVLLSVSYVAVAALLLSLNLATPWRWQIKVAGIVIVSALYVGAYSGAKDLLGWPSRTAIPDYFRLHWAIITEPDKFTGGDGRILVWLEALDQDDQSLSPPRAYRMPYDDALAQRIERALGKISEGRSITGSRDAETASEDKADKKPGTRASEGTDKGDADGWFQTTGPPPDLHFEQMRPPKQPAKQVL